MNYFFDSLMHNIRCACMPCFQRIQALLFLYAAPCLLFCFTTLLQAQRFSERDYIINPLASRAAALPDGELEWMSSFGGWGGFDRYLVRDDAHGWRNHLGAFAEICRSGNDWNVLAVSTFEHVIDLNNDISFNPRVIWWEEGLVFSHRLRSSGKIDSSSSVNTSASSHDAFLQVGYWHRCKHEVDNLFSGTERVLIYGSFTGKYIVPLLQDTRQLWLAARADVYTIRADYRTPALFDRTQPMYNQLVGTLGANVHYRAPLPAKQLGWYASARLHLTAFSTTNKSFFGRFTAIDLVQPNIGAALGISVEGKAGRFQFGLNYEYLSDPEVLPFPSPQHLLTLGFVFMSPQGLW